MKPVDRSAPGVRGKNEDPVAGSNLGRRITREFQPIDVTRAGADQAVPRLIDDPADQDGQFLGETREDATERSRLGELELDHSRFGEQTRDSEQLYRAAHGLTVRPVRRRSRPCPAVQVDALIAVCSGHVERRWAASGAASMRPWSDVVSVITRLESRRRADRPCRRFGSDSLVKWGSGPTKAASYVLLSASPGARAFVRPRAPRAPHPARLLVRHRARRRRHAPPGL
jgi:hypothetical protein